MRCGSFFFNDTATTEIYTLSLHDALPISAASASLGEVEMSTSPRTVRAGRPAIVVRSTSKSTDPPPSKVVPTDRKSTRLNSSHANISYAVFCLKKNTHSPYSQLYSSQMHG